MLKYIGLGIGHVMNGICATAVMMFALGVWPVKADTTGVVPSYEILNSNAYLMDTQFTTGYSGEEALCLTENMYFEARSDGYAGMYATTMVVLNRVDDPRYPDTICDVVRQGPTKESWKTRQDPDLIDAERVYFPVKNRCQFSWYCDGKADEMRDEASYYLAKDIATMVLEATLPNSNQLLPDVTEGSTHYHTVAISPNWIHDRGMARITQVGSHYFYRWAY
tara:strand:- start:3248 stop:3913 length:666 start_codon:yes stop_codon:yes gene_type:complete